MGYNEMDRVWDKSQASKSDKLVLLAIARRYTVGKGAYPSQQYLSKACGMNVRSVRASLTRLKALGELDWIVGSAKSKKANTYLIAFLEDTKTPAKREKTSAINDKNTRPLNKILNKVLNEEKVVFDASFASPFMMRSLDRVSGVLTPLQVSDLLSSFASSYDCVSAYTDEIRVARWWACLDKAASQAEREI